MLQVAHNYEPGTVSGAGQTRGGYQGQRPDRVPPGVSRPAHIVLAPDLICPAVATQVQQTRVEGPVPACVLIDEAQFLTPEQVDQALEVAVFTSCR